MKKGYKRHLHHVQKLWNYCNVLRDDSMSYGDYVEQLSQIIYTTDRP